MIKKFILITTLFITTFLMQWHIATVSAQSQPQPQQNPTPEQLFSGFVYTDQAHKNQTNKIDYVRNLPKGSWQEILAAVINFILGICGTLALISFTVGGVMMVTARGEEDKITKAKGILLWSIAGLAIIAVSYALVLGISQLKIF